jgi:hypothetical protein
MRLLTYHHKTVSINTTRRRSLARVVLTLLSVAHDIIVVGASAGGAATRDFSVDILRNIA